MMLRTVSATRYMTPLREGGSLPAIVEADDGHCYVMKFSGAGQGPKALIAEVVAGEIGRALGLPVPEIVFIELDAALGQTESNPEIRELVMGSVGLNVGLRYLPNAYAYQAVLSPPDPHLASAIVWFDAYVTNVDRTPRNVNILWWQHGLWLIDHGAALYFHHSWDDYLARSRSRFPLIKDHALLGYAAYLDQADAAARGRLTRESIEEVTQVIPDAWLNGEAVFPSGDGYRRAYATYLLDRLDASALFVEEAHHARAQRL